MYRTGRDYRACHETGHSRTPTYNLVYWRCEIRAASSACKAWSQQDRLESASCHPSMHVTTKAPPGGMWLVRRTARAPCLAAWCHHLQAHSVVPCACHFAVTLRCTAVGIKPDTQCPSDAASIHDASLRPVSFYHFRKEAVPLQRMRRPCSYTIQITSTKLSLLFPAWFVAACTRACTQASHVAAPCRLHARKVGPQSRRGPHAAARVPALLMPPP
jgi:hypothetical protein